VVPAELPIDIDSFKSQQHRWAMGSVQTCRKLLLSVLRAPLSARAKLEAFVHLTANNTYLLMVLLSLLVFPAMVFRQGEQAWKLLLIDLPLFASATLAMAAFFLVSQREPGGTPAATAWRRLPALMALGIGLAVNNSKAVVAGWKERGGVFHRTPKYRGAEKKSYLPRRGSSLPVESLLAAYFAACFAAAIFSEMWLSLPFLWLFLQGYGYVAWMGIALRRAA
jgi:cellulose synthase/poly-beta-1,6-N-acetylglucosamine synthase-like glycosyltransferase